MEANGEVSDGKDNTIPALFEFIDKWRRSAMTNVGSGLRESEQGGEGATEFVERTGSSARSLARLPRESPAQGRHSGPVWVGSVIACISKNFISVL